MSADPTFTKILNTNDFHLHRKPLIQNLQKILNAKVICYTASPMHPLNGIMSQDIIHFEDLLRSTAGAEERLPYYQFTRWRRKRCRENNYYVSSTIF